MKELRFVTDGMLGKLTRWLRMLGHDVDYTRSTEDKALIQKAKKENRILLTRDVELYRQAIAKGADTFLIENPDQTANLAQLAKRYGFQLKVNVKTSRCPKCNGKIKTIPKTSVKDKIPKTTSSNYEEFWQCQTCAQIYWHGAHWKRIDKTLTQAEKALKNLNSRFCPATEVEEKNHNRNRRNIEDANLQSNIKKTHNKTLDNEHKNSEQNQNGCGQPPSTNLILVLQSNPSQRKKKMKMATLIHASTTSAGCPGKSHRAAFCESL